MIGPQVSAASSVLVMKLLSVMVQWPEMAFHIRDRECGGLRDGSVEHG